MKPELEVTPAGEQGENETTTCKRCWGAGRRELSCGVCYGKCPDCGGSGRALTPQATALRQQRERRLEDAAPALYEALTGLLRVARLSSWAHVTNGPCECKDCAIANATAVLALVDGSQDQETK